jgi:tRNA dimethylallyltransferase
MQPKLVVITGPTASGKTALGVMLAQRLGGEVVSADSMQIYRGMDIGTAKPTPEEMQGVPHHMIDIADPAENYSVSRYAKEASACVDDILARGKLPIVVGGTGLYIDSLIAGRTFADGTADTALRQELSERYDEIGGEGLLGELRKVDPERAAKLHPADKKRIVRAMEVYILTGRTITQHDAETRAVPPRYDAAKIALDFAVRQDLYDRIDRRVDIMVQQGLFDEVRALLAAGVPADCTAMQAIGYKEAAAAVQGKAAPQDAVAAIQLASRRYAKRQLTWLRRDQDLFWLRHEKTPDMDRACRLSTQFLSARGIE